MAALAGQPVPAPGFAPALPDATTSQEDAFKLLAMNLEGALKADWTAKKIWSDVVLKFPEFVRIQLKSMSPEQIAVEIQEYAPPEWTLNSPRGHRLIVELSMYLQFPE